MDVIDLKDFYASDLGRIARRLLGSRLRNHWDNITGMSCVGIGYGVPYLGTWRAEAELAACLMPARQGVIHWPEEGPSAVCLIDEVDMPLAESSIDRVLIVHGLEMTDAPEEMLREAWRILKPGGRLLLVVPNRRGMWARVDKTPFGHGRPFSRGQMTKYLRDAMFNPEAWSTALFVPPSTRAFFRKSAVAWERMGRRFWPGFSGVLVVEATKQVYARTAAKTKRQSFRRLRPVLAPIPASFDGLRCEDKSSL